jgi:hypothetical protein
MSPTGSRAQAQILKKISTVLLSKLLKCTGALRIEDISQRPAAWPDSLFIYLFKYVIN